MSGARSGAQTTGQVISAIDIADISIRALREESDRCGNAGRGLGFVVSTHFLREEGDSIVLAGGDAGAISIRALREEGDR